MTKMVQVKMLTIAAGPQGNLQPGDVVSLTPEMAEAFVEGRYAKYVTPPAPQRGEKKPAEAAAVKQDETAALPAAQKRTSAKQTKSKAEAKKEEAKKEEAKKEEAK